MRVVGMNYQDDAWPEMSGALSGALAGGVISIGAENFVPPEYFMARWPDLWVEAEQRLRGRRGLSRRYNAHGRDCLSLALDLLDALAEDESDGRESARLRLAKSLPKNGRASFKKLREKCHGVLDELRDRIDIQGYLVALPIDCEYGGRGRPMSTYKLPQWQLVDRCLHGLGRLFDNWATEPAAMELILGHPTYPGIEPIEVRQLRRGACKAEWLLRWSDHFGPRDEKGYALLAGPRVTGKKFAAQNLTVAIQNVIEELSVEAQRCNAESDRQDATALAWSRKGNRPLWDDDGNDVDWLMEVGEMVIGSGQDRLLDRPDVDQPQEEDDPVPDGSAGDEGDDSYDSDGSWGSTEHGEGDDVEDRNGADVGSDEQPGDSTEAEDSLPTVEALIQRCLARYPLAIQVSVVLELHRGQSAEAGRQIKRMGVFESWGISADVNGLTPAVLRDRYVQSEGAISEREFLGKQRVAYRQVVESLRVLLRGMPAGQGEGE